MVCRLCHVKGAPGEKGEKGSIGPRGETGNIGPRGEKGSNGLKGDKGDQGVIGDRGLMGEKGQKGDPGPMGNNGERGPKVIIHYIVILCKLVGKHWGQGHQGRTWPKRKKRRKRNQSEIISNDNKTSIMGIRELKGRKEILVHQVKKVMLD